MALYFLMDNSERSETAKSLAQASLKPFPAVAYGTSPNNLDGVTYFKTSSNNPGSRESACGGSSEFAIPNDMILGLTVIDSCYTGPFSPPRPIWEVIYDVPGSFIVSPVVKYLLSQPGKIEPIEPSEDNIIGSLSLESDQPGSEVLQSSSDFDQPEILTVAKGTSWPGPHRIPNPDSNPFIFTIKNASVSIFIVKRAEGNPPVEREVCQVNYFFEVINNNWIKKENIPSSPIRVTLLTGNKAVLFTGLDTKWIGNCNFETVSHSGIFYAPAAVYEPAIGVNLNIGYSGMWKKCS